MKRLLREPLVHFLLLGALLFGVWQFTQDGRSAHAPWRQVQLSLEELTQLVLVFQSQWRREPSPEELGRVVENRIQEEILYREGLAMGLDKDDTIVRRRMAQKLQFLAEDVAKAREPTREELEAWYAKNAHNFAQPNRVSFRHLYFSPDRRGARASDDAAKALATLAGQPQDSKLTTDVADRFMFQDYYRDRTPEQLAREFGPQFALAVAKFAPAAWRGPIESGLGWHLVYVDTVIAGSVPAFEEVEQDVKTAWLTEQKAIAWQKAYQDMRAKYTVLLPTPNESTSSRAAPAMTLDRGPAGSAAKNPS